MKLKVPLIIISIIAIIILSFIVINEDNKNGFIDYGTSSNNNDNWINHGISIARSNEFTTLSGNSNSSLWCIANFTTYNDFIVEWDNHGTPNNCDYCLISNIERTNESALNLVDDLNITHDCHVKLVIANNNITPYVDGTMKKPIRLNTNPDEGMVFRFQINTNGSNIKYSNFKIHNMSD